MPLAEGIEPFYQQLGTQIAAQRTRLHWSQEDLGNRLNPPMTRASIANIEWGKQRVLAHTIKQLADALNVPVSLLFGTASEHVSDYDKNSQPPIAPEDLENDIMRAAAEISHADAKRIASEVLYASES